MNLSLGRNMDTRILLFEHLSAKQLIEAAVRDEMSTHMSRNPSDFCLYLRIEYPENICMKFSIVQQQYLTDISQPNLYRHGCMIETARKKKKKTKRTIKKSFDKYSFWHFNLPL